MNEGPPRWVVVAVIVAAMVFTLPPLARPLTTDLDGSWQLGLHLARERGLVVGRDIVFNYGPWGFLMFPLVLSRSLWMASVVFTLAVQILALAALWAWTRSHLRPWAALGAWLVFLLVAPPLEYTLLLALLLAVRLTLGAKRPRAMVGLVLGGVAGATALVKFSIGLAALLILAGGCAAALGARRRAGAAALAAGFVAGGFGASLVALGGAAASLDFLTRSWWISSGYSAALQRGGPLWPPLAFLGAALLFACGLFREGGDAWRRSAALLAPAAGLLLIAFRHGFIRQETHSPIALGVGAILLAWCALETAGVGGPVSRWLRTGSASALLAAALIVQPPSPLLHPVSHIAGRVEGFLAAERTTRDPKGRDETRRALRAKLPLGEGLRRLVDGRTVDVLTVDTALVEAWDLDWRPRPVLQSYAVGTLGLDRLEAAFFAGPRAPERLIVAPRGVDTRHPLMDEPLMWREIFLHYDPLAADDRWLVLGRRSEARQIVERAIGRTVAAVNDAVVAPAPARGHLEVSISVAPSLLGRLVAAVWKAPEIRLLAAASRPQAPRRLIPATAVNPFPLLFPWPDEPAALAEALAPEGPPAPLSLALFTMGSWAWRDAQIEFREVEWRPPAGRAVRRTSAPPPSPGAGLE